MKIIFFTRFGPLGASSRLRALQFLPYFRLLKIEPVVSPLIGDAMLLRKYQLGGYGFISLLMAYLRRIYELLKSNQYDLVWIEKEALPWFPVWFEIWLLRKIPYVLDFDDAIFHTYDLHRFNWVRSFYGDRIDQLMEGSRLVFAGNRYLARRADAAGARWIELIPTVVDISCYFPKYEYLKSTASLIVWIGSPSTVKYLLELAEPLSLLAKSHSFTLRVIGAGAIYMPGVRIETFPWSLDDEAALINGCDIGIMPLKDSPWEQGKCAYKLIQYMACGLPTVASPVGANREVVIENKTGFFANTPKEWVEKMHLLLTDAPLRQRLGRAGRERVQSDYSLQQTASRLAALLTATEGI